MASRAHSRSHVVADGSVYHICRTLDVALRERYALNVRVEQNELANIPGEAVPDPVTGRLAQRVVNQIGVLADDCPERSRAS